MCSGSGGTALEGVPSPDARRLPRWLAPVLGGAIAVLAIAFVVRSLGKDWDRIAEAFSTMAIAPAVFAAMVASSEASLPGMKVSVCMGEHSVRGLRATHPLAYPVFCRLTRARRAGMVCR